MPRFQFFILMLLTSIASIAHNYVVCVGVADYPGTNKDLRLCANDARAIQQVYEKNGNATVRLFVDGQATVADIESAFRQLCIAATTDDAVIFFFSGHGSLGAFGCVDGQMKYERVISLLRLSQAKQKIVFADACFSGKARLNKHHTESHIQGDAGVMFFLSSRTNETSMENRGIVNGYFTAYLERGLRGGADVNRDRRVTARELFDFVSKNVVKETKERQHPVMWGSFDDDMPVMVW